MRVCDCCGGTQFEINHIDEALCCTNCGSVSEEAQLQVEAGDYYSTSDPNKNIESHGICKWLRKYAVYFGGSEETYKEALEWFKNHLKYCPQVAEREVALYIVYIIRKPWIPGLTIDDLIIRCPDAINPLKLRKVHSLLSPHVNYVAIDWKAKVERTFPNIYSMVSKNILKHREANLKKTRRPSPYMLPKKDKVLTMTKKLIDLFCSCENQIGKLPDAVITTAVTLCFLYYFQRSISIKTPRAPIFTVQQMFNPEEAAVHINCNYRTLLSYLNEMQTFILTCARQLPWLQKEKKVRLKTAYYYLDEVLEYVKPKDVINNSIHNNNTNSQTREGDEEAGMRKAKPTFDLAQETVPAFLRSKQQSFNKELALERAKAGDINKFKKNTLEYNMRILLNNGFGEKKILEKTEIQLRNLCAQLYFRKLVNSVVASNIPDLDDVRITKHEMSETELESYLHTFHSGVNNECTYTNTTTNDSDK